METKGGPIEEKQIEYYIMVFFVNLYRPSEGVLC